MYPRQSLTPRCSAKPARHPAHPDVDPHALSRGQLPLMLMTMTIITVFNRRVKTNAFLMVLFSLSCSTFKDDNVKQKNYDNDFQSEGKNQWIFNGFVITLKLDDFLAKWSFSIGV